MRSISSRGYTVVTVITLFLAPILNGHAPAWVQKVVGVEKQTTVVACTPNAPCPQHVVIHRTATVNP